MYVNMEMRDCYYCADVAICRDMNICGKKKNRRHTFINDAKLYLNWGGAFLNATIIIKTDVDYHFIFQKPFFFA